MASYSLTRWVLLRGLALVYLFSFLSFTIEVAGLVGPDGIAPAGEFFEAQQHQLGTSAQFLVPSVFWFDASQRALQGVGIAGILFSVAGLFGILPLITFTLLWGLTLSCVTVGQLFYSYQWDTLLLEAGFLALFLAPLSFVHRLSSESPPQPVFIWLFRWLVFRLMFFSGLVKLMSGDLSWQNLTALTFHYETQPLPNPLSWYAHQLPLWFQRGSAALMFVIELVLPFCIFGPRALRVAAFFGFSALQILIFATGNYTFFNLLALVLTLSLLDDKSLSRFVPEGLFREYVLTLQNRAASGWKNGVAAVVASLLFAFSLIPIGGLAYLPPVLQQAFLLATPYHISSSYGLFAVMTQTRNEIILEGSVDGKEWLPYEFTYKPGALERVPGQIAPLQARLDWQMWFAALGTCRQNPWFLRFQQRILENSPSVLALLETNPFVKTPPRFIRSLLYRYSFTSWGEKNWWKREQIGPYCPIIALKPSPSEKPKATHNK
ncbi:MAG: lipase maturation factor family protein [Bdellovibrionales bacterium]|nr:lipase maturation factor family protein [Bdellovibrionales bacterium]